MCATRWLYYRDTDSCSLSVVKLSKSALLSFLSFRRCSHQLVIDSANRVAVRGWHASQCCTSHNQFTGEGFCQVHALTVPAQHYQPNTIEAVLTGTRCCRTSSALSQSTKGLLQRDAVTAHNLCLSTSAAAAPKLLVIHPNRKSDALLQEALRLAESYAGRQAWLASISSHVSPLSSAA